jgi:hypothetical protein
VAVVVVLVGLYFAYSRYITYRALKSVYGGNIAGMLAGGALQNQIAQEIAKQAQEETNEANKNPFDSATEIEAYDDISKAVLETAKPIVESVFGKSKLTGFNSGFMAAVTGGKSGGAQFVISRPAEAKDMGVLQKTITDKGMKIITSSIDEKSAIVMAMENGTSQLTVSFELGEQEVMVIVVKQ